MLFEQPHFLEGVGKKDGDLIVAAACKTWDVSFQENTCAVEGREKQHDPMFLTWSCKGMRWAGAGVPRHVRRRIDEWNARTAWGHATSSAGPPSPPPGVARLLSGAAVGFATGATEDAEDGKGNPS